MKQNIKLRISNDLHCRKYMFDDPDVYQLVNKFEQTFEDCMQ